MNLLGYRIVLSRDSDSLRFEWSSSPMAPLTHFLLWVSLCLAIVGCSKVKQPTSDSTPPTLVWNVFNHGTREQADHPGSPTIHAKRGGSYRITLNANDPEGVKSIQITSGKKAWGCIAPPGGENVQDNKHFDFDSTIDQNLSPDQNGMVLTSVVLISELKLAMDCRSGWSFASGVSELKGQASNYFGGVTTEVIKFTVTP